MSTIATEATQPQPVNPKEGQIKRIVLCFDGTGDWVGTNETNVAKIYGHLNREEQVCYYDGGVGTLTDPTALTGLRRMTLRLIDLGTATSLRSKVLQGYLFLSQHATEETEIVMFGFSRGAYTARVLAGLIHHFGILLPDCVHLAPYFWEAFSSATSEEDAARMGKKLRGSFCQPWQPVIGFMGLFDTVSSVGVVGRFNIHPGTDKNPSIKRVCHAVSIDEQRNVFPESLMHPFQDGLSEVWFPGVHRDVGGGLPAEKSRIADEALAWIEQEAVIAGIRLNALTEPNVVVPPRPNYASYDPYVPLGFYPMKMFSKRLSEHRFVWPNFRNLRLVPEGAVIHPIGIELLVNDSQYAPQNWPMVNRPFLVGPGKSVMSAYEVRKLATNLSDFARILLGSFFLLILACIWTPCNVGVSVLQWSTASKVCLGIGFLSFFAVQLFGQRLPKYAETLTRLLVLVLLGLHARLNDSTATLAIGLVIGLASFIVAQLPIGKPVMRADRTLPYLLKNLGAASVTLWLIMQLLQSFTHSAVILPTLPVACLVAFFVTMALIEVYRDRCRMAHPKNSEDYTREVDRVFDLEKRRQELKKEFKPTLTK